MAEYKTVWVIDEKRIPDAVVQAIKRKFTPDLMQFERVMKELKYDGLNGCYYFMYAGMFHGVEPDGYIHT